MICRLEECLAIGKLEGAQKKKADSTARVTSQSQEQHYAEIHCPANVAMPEPIFLIPTGLVNRWSALSE